MEEKVVLTVDECAEYLGISRPQAYLGVHRGDIPHIRVGKRILVPRAALEKLLANAGEKVES
jgi:excisionase family DNA binding protein